MADNLSNSISKLRCLAGSLHITGDTNEQTLILAIIDVLDEFAEVIGSESKADVLSSQCPNCGKTISLDVTNLRGGEPMVCDSCHEIIGILSDKI